MAMDFTVANAPLYLWHAVNRGIAAAAAAAALAAGWQIRCEIVWNKNIAQYGALTAQYKQKTNITQHKSRSRLRKELSKTTALGL
jgi:hypothetical protein